MKAQNDIESYVSDLRGRLHLRADVLERIVSESEAHLQDRAAAHVATGMDRREAESQAVAEFGPAWRVALRFRLAYLDVKKVLAWTGALLLVAYKVYGICSLAFYPRIGGSQRLTFIGISIGYLAIELALGFVITAISPRRLILGAGLASSMLVGFYIGWLIVSVHRLAGSGWEGHVWNGWQSGFCGRYPLSTVGTSSHIVLLRDGQIVSTLLLAFAWILMGVWVAGAIRAKIAGRRARRAIA